jgi:tRNA 2-selenouridine synthase
MSVHLISADEAMARYDRFDAVIDARSEGEHAEDHLPGALNWPSLNNEERIRVGTLYKQVSPFEAQKIGASLVAANISRHIQAHVMDKPKSWQPLIYCWRGGKRSNSLALILGQIGFKVHLIEGGYKAFRKAVVEDTPRRVAPLQFRVLCGPTGSGKTRLLQALAAQGAQVLDLEAIASHRASVLGVIPGQPQPTQKAFETRLWHTLRQLDPARPVFVEAESKKVGNLTVPDSLMAAMRASPCARLELSLAHRVQLLMEDYDYFARDAAFFCERLDKLIDLKGRALIDDWKARVHAGQTAEVVAELLEKHYDPGYETSTARNFVQYAQAPVLQLGGPDSKAMAEAASQCLVEPPQTLHTHQGH